MKLSIVTNGHAFLVVTSGGEEVRRIDIKQALAGNRSVEVEDAFLGTILIEEGVPNDIAARGYMSVPVTVLFEVPDGKELFVETESRCRQILGGQISFTHVQPDGSHKVKHTGDTWSIKAMTFDFVEQQLPAEALLA